MDTEITSLRTRDVRFPTSRTLVGSDATNKDPDYSAAYLELGCADGSRGYALIFTIGRGNELCCAAIEAFARLVIGRRLGAITEDMGAFCEYLRSDSQLRWLGPEKGIVQMAAGCIINAVWDLWARREGLPVWRLVSAMDAEQFVASADLRYLSDVLSREEALDLVRRHLPGRDERIATLQTHGYPAYTTSPGWLGYDDAQLETLCRKAVADGFRNIKLKVGASVEDDVRRLRIARETVGDDIGILIDANQAWEVDQAVAWLQRLRAFAPTFIEEPTSPDDVLGHLKIRRALGDLRVASGEHCQNRVVFKQFIESGALDVVQLDACRMGGLSEMLAVGMLAAKFERPVWPHAGGVGLCEYVQHYSMIDCVMLAGTTEGRSIEYVDHLHEHFEDPCRIEAGAYVAPSQPGFSVKMHDASLARYEYPVGAAWRERHAAGA